MTQTTDAALVERLRGLLAAAIPTPWQSLVADDARLLDAINENSAVVTDRVAGLIFSRAMPGGEGHGVTIATINARRATLDTDTASADLITDAVNALPGLLDTIEAQARRIEALEGAGQSLLDRATMLATRCHEGQVDKGGQPYILHPLRVMLACQTEQERITAVLHDVMEDCDVSWATIARRFGDTIADAVAALTREEGESYTSFIKRCATNPIARTVKLADLADNMDVRRLGREPTTEDAKRLHCYADARALLSMDPTP